MSQKSVSVVDALLPRFWGVGEVVLNHPDPVAIMWGQEYTITVEIDDVLDIPVVYP